MVDEIVYRYLQVYTLDLIYIYMIISYEVAEAYDFKGSKGILNEKMDSSKTFPFSAF
jgi:hypothetical protein